MSNPLKPSSKWPRWKKWICLTAVVLLGLELIYVSLANWYLSSDRFRQLVNRRPDHFFMKWTSARTWLPGRFHFRDVVMIGQGTRDIWYGAMRECQFRVAAASLLQKEVFCPWFDGVGVEFRLGRRDDPPLRPVESHFPPIPGLETLPRRSDPRRTRRNNPWRVKAEKVNLEEVTQIWILGLRLQGTGGVDGRVNMAVSGPFQASVNAYEIPHATLTFNGATVSTNLLFRLAGQLGPLIFADSKGEKLYTFLDAHLRTSGELLNLSMLGPRAGASGVIDLGGSGRIDADVKVQAGAYQPGSALSIVSPDLRVRLGNYSLKGDARIEDKIEVSTNRSSAQLRVHLSNLQLWHKDRHISGATGPDLTLESTASDLRMIGRFQDADLRFHMAPLTIPDLTLMNEYLPPGLETTFHSGHITAVADFSRTPSRRLVGRIELNGEGLGARIKSNDYLVDLRLDGRFDSDPSAPERFDITGSSLVFTNVVAPKLSAKTQADWHARVDFQKGGLTVKPTWAVHSEVGLVLHDTRPIVALLRSHQDAPGWLGLLPTFKDLNGRVDVELSSERMILQQIDITGKATELLGNLDLKGSALRGLLYIRYGLFSVGLDMREERRHWHLLGAKRWYDSEVTLEKPEQPANPANTTPK